MAYVFLLLVRQRMSKSLFSTRHLPQRVLIAGGNASRQTVKRSLLPKTFQILDTDAPYIMLLCCPSVI